MLLRRATRSASKTNTKDDTSTLSSIRDLEQGIVIRTLQSSRSLILVLTGVSVQRSGEEKLQFVSPECKSEF